MQNTVAGFHKKTFNIGESAVGGVISVIVSEKEITIINRHWDFNKGSDKNSDQSEAPERERFKIDRSHFNLLNEIDNYLNELTSCYYAGQIVDWIKSKY